LFIRVISLTSAIIHIRFVKSIPFQSIINYRAFIKEQMEEQRVVITGLGTINSIAKSVPEFARALKEGVCGIGPVTVFDTTERFYP
jgi:hypothetical protein